MKVLVFVAAEGGSSEAEFSNDLTVSPVEVVAPTRLD